MTNRAIMDKSMSEEDFARAVVDLALSCGWKVNREPPWRMASRLRGKAQDSRNGFPDLVLARGGQVIFAELKAQKGRVSAAQWAWLNELVGHDYVWRPSDWEVIVEVLR